MSISPTFIPPMIPVWKLRTRVTSPGVECVTLAEAKQHLRLPLSYVSEDAYLQALIDAAQELAQEYTGRKFTTTVLAGLADDQMTVSPWWQGTITAPAAAVLGPYARGLEIPWPPLQTVEEVAFVDLQGNKIVLPSTSYIVDASDKDRIGRVILKYFVSLGNIPQEVLAVVCNFTAGYGLAAAVPKAIKQGLFLLIAYMYDNRGACGDSLDGPMKTSGAAALLQPYRIMRV